MLTLENEALFTVRGHFSLAPDEEEMLAKCYMPMIGASAFSLYHVLLSMQDRNEGNFYSAPELADRMGTSLASVKQDMLFLEAVGLLATYREEKAEKVNYLFRLFRPLRPESFFKNPMFVTLLSSKISERRERELMASFLKEAPIGDNFVDISAKFSDVFSIQPDFDTYNRLSGEELKKYVEDLKDPAPAFETDKLLSALAGLSVGREAVEDSLRDIALISGVYGLDENTSAELIKGSCLTSEGVFSLPTFKKNAENYHKYGVAQTEAEYSPEFGTSDYAKVLAEAQRKSPLEFLSSLLGFEPPKSYKDLIYKLADQYRVPFPVLNVVLHYTFQQCNHFLPEEYCVKTAISLLSRKIYSAGEAYAALYQDAADYQEKKARREKSRTKLAADMAAQTPEEEKKPEDNKSEGETIDWDAIVGGNL
jgi:replication initiation and membrane attachment protein